MPTPHDDEIIGARWFDSGELALGELDHFARAVLRAVGRLDPPGP